MRNKYPSSRLNKRRKTNSIKKKCSEINKHLSIVDNEMSKHKWLIELIK